MATTIIFGFGSLINTASLRSTVLEVADVKPAYVNGFVRQFNLWDDVGIRADSPGSIGIPYCALDVKQILDSKSRINGVAFSVSESQLDKLKARERGYKLVKTTAYDFNTNEKLGECYLFSACMNNGEYDFKSKAQTQYLRICREGAKKFGDKFYQEFLDTTYIGDKKLNQVLELLDER